MAGRLNLGEAVGGREARRDRELSAERGKKRAAEIVGDSLLALVEDKPGLAAGIRPSPEERTAHSSCNHLASQMWFCVSAKLWGLVFPLRFHPGRGKEIKRNHIRIKRLQRSSAKRVFRNHDPVKAKDNPQTPVGSSQCHVGTVFGFL